MPNDSSEIVVGANGTVWVAPVGTTLPADIDEALAVDFVDVGFVSENGATFTDSKEITDINAWQSFYPVRRIISSRSSQLAFAIRQWNSDNVKFAFGGGQVTSTANGFEYTPPDPSELDERALCLEWADDTKNYRLVFPRGLVSENVESTAARTSAMDLPITFSAVSDGS